MVVTVKNTQVLIVYVIKVLIIRELPLHPVRLRRRRMHIVIEMKRSLISSAEIARLVITYHQISLT